MKRWLFKLSAALSLLLCVATLVLWIRSYWASESLDLVWRGTKDGNITARVLGIMEARGGIAFIYEDDSYIGPDWADFFAKKKPLDFEYDEIPGFGYPVPIDQKGVAAELGFCCCAHDQPLVDGSATARIYQVTMPFWFFAMITAVLPGYFILKYRQKRASLRWKSGHCGICGYDLRASKERCPECGSPIPFSDSARS